MSTDHYLDSFIKISNIVSEALASNSDVVTIKKSELEKIRRELMKAYSTILECRQMLDRLGEMISIRRNES